MTDTSRPFADTKFLTIKGRRMACIDEGDDPAIVFLHGSPTSLYLWRNVMPGCRGLGRLVACDMIGIGKSEKLPDSGPGRYTNSEQAIKEFTPWLASSAVPKLYLHTDHGVPDHWKQREICKTWLFFYSDQPVMACKPAWALGRFFE